MFTKSPLSVSDDIGVVYLAPNRVLRAINNDRIGEVNALLNSGLIEALVREGLFPRTHVASQPMPGHTLVLEHEFVSPTTYPSEWSPEMLRRAALCVLRVNEIAEIYGYELKDAHPHNLLFRGVRPIFVDFGSLVPIDGKPGWRAENEFRQCYLYPLRLYQSGLQWTFRRAFLGDGSGVPLVEYLLLRHPLLRLAERSRLSKLVKYWRAYKNPRLITSQLIEEELHRPWLRGLARFVASSKRLPFRRHNLKRLQSTVNSMNLASITTWGDYHSELISDDGNTRLSPRLRRIVDIVASLQPRTALDLAGNQGALARALASLPSMSRTICADYDARAIDLLVERTSLDETVCPVVCNLMGDASPADSLSRQKRFKSEVVLALAVTHHLILTQRYALDSVLDALEAFSSAFVLVEFMPLGLHNGINAQPLPAWYTSEWFETGLRRKFDIISIEKLEENRVLYVAQIRDLSMSTICN